MFKLISWNVNGIRAALRKDAFTFLSKERPDVLCLQETRARPEEAGDLLPSLRYKAWNPATKPGYSGTTVFSRHAPLSVRAGINARAHDGEGRVLAFELEQFFVVSVYTPNSQRELTRLAYRRSWDRAFLRYLERLEQEKPVV
jgi:exodeoxyribonuclease III